MVAPRKGSPSVKDVPADVLVALERGDIETATLAETLAVDFTTLARRAFPDLPAAAISRIQSVASKGVTVRMRAVGDVLNDFSTPERIDAAGTHASDIVRGWAAYTISPTLPIDQQLETVRRFADDHHFGVREWAWLALRGSICADPFGAINYLRHWAADPRPHIRRFAVEATRPRGVWATHITQLKTDPAPALPILDQVCLDSDDYVHRSVGNWLRDAARTNPHWVIDTINDWEQRHGQHRALERLRQRTTV